MTELQAERAIETYQRRKREIRNRELYYGMRGMDTAEQFLRALRCLEGLNTKERESVRRGKILQTLA